MRVPHVISQNTIDEYHPSPESLNLVGENQRRIIAEDFDWNKDECPSLADFCVQSINENFEQFPIVYDLPCADRDYLLEQLSVDLPLELVIPLIKEDIYWKKRYNDKFGVYFERKFFEVPWKDIYIERHIAYCIENAQPQYSDETSMDDILTLCSSYIKKLKITELQPWIPPLTWDESDIPEKYPIEHIDFGPILAKLPLVNEFDLIFGKNNVEENFEWYMFKVSIPDCEKLVNALLQLQSLTILRIHRSFIEDDHVRALTQGLVQNETLVELDLSHCKIGDKGALCLGKLIQKHPTLERLILANNLIEEEGAEGIGFSILEDNSCPLKHLDLRLNPLKHEGTLAILRVLVRSDKPVEVNLAGCLFTDETSERILNTLNINNTLKFLDVSNNWFGEELGECLVNAIQENTVIERIDLRETGISELQYLKIKNLLRRNRHNGQLDDLEDEYGSEEHVSEEEETQKGESVTEKQMEEKSEVSESKSEG